jgi:hypothetical protein
MPTAGGLPRDPKAAGDLSLRASLLEQADGLQAALPGGLGTQGRGRRRRGRGALRHDHRLTTREASEYHPILRACVAVGTTMLNTYGPTNMAAITTLVLARSIAIADTIPRRERSPGVATSLFDFPEINPNDATKCGDQYGSSLTRTKPV